MNTKTEHERMLLQELFFGLSASIESFLEDRKARGRRPDTLKTYRRELERFREFAEQTHVESLDEITPQLLRLYFISLRKTRQAANSIHDAYRPIKTWLRWSWEEYELETRNPIERVSVEKPDEEPRPGIPLPDVEKLLEATSLGQNEARDRALFLVFLDTGIRRSEMSRLNVEDLGRDGSITVKSISAKNKTTRIVYLVTETRRALLAYLREREELNPGDPLFLTDESARLSPFGIYQVLRRRSRNTGIPSRGLHAFRRTFATETYRGTDEIKTSKLMGHGKNRGDLNSTRRYLELHDDQLRQAHETSSPVKKLKNARKKAK